MICPLPPHTTTCQKMISPYLTRASTPPKPWTCWWTWTISFSPKRTTYKRTNINNVSKDKGWLTMETPEFVSRPTSLHMCLRSGLWATLPGRENARGTAFWRTRSALRKITYACSRSRTTSQAATETLLWRTSKYSPSAGLRVGLCVCAAVHEWYVRFREEEREDRRNNTAHVWHTLTVDVVPLWWKDMDVNKNGKNFKKPTSHTEVVNN